MKKKITIPLAIIFCAFIGICLIPDTTIWGNDKFSKVVYDDNGEILRAYLNSDEQWCFQLKNYEIPKKLKTAVLTYEDRGFYKHFGVNPFAILRALKQNITNNKIISGASTLTMQVMRISQPKRRTYLNKFIEILCAIRTEIFYSKDEILKMYFERAPYGSNIMGVKAASEKYFLKSPDQLSWGEASLLAVLPNAPGIIFPGTSQTKLLAKRNQLLKTLFDLERIDQITYEISLEEPIPQTIYKFPQSAFHFSDFVLSQSKEIEVETTLNYEIQRRVESIVQNYKYNLYSKGIQNLSVLVVETKTGKIKGYIGSQDFMNNRFKGKVDGVQAPRSSGSILKPLLYAGAIEQGMLLPQMKIEDVQTSYQGMIPENYTKDFLGMVTVTDALTKSLNVPAVRLLEEYSVDKFYYLLKDFGFKNLFRKPNEYGLSLIIGGAEVKLWDTVQAFATLGNYGEKINLRWNNWQKFSDDKRELLHPGSCYLTLKMMENVKRPGLSEYWQNFASSKKISWKTGTSFGHRDAWAVGTTPEFTVGVWVGNFKGESNKNLVGTTAAGPLLMKVFDTLDSKEEFQIPVQDVETIKVCKETGFPLSNNCDQNNFDEVLRPSTNKLYPVCPYCKNLEVDDSEKYAVCSLCWDLEKHHSKRFTIYPSLAEKILREKYRNKENIPAHNPKCEFVQASSEISILTPGENSKIWLPRLGNGKRQKLVMEATHINPDQTLYWYLDQYYLGTTKNIHQTTFAPDAGKHKLTISDINGNETSVNFTIMKNEVEK